ncbi:N-acetylmuramoyl-L-alanine amidase [Paenibacillus sp. YPG26]|uniref:N-acetylmuramoyl-L-alanine amidase family protein n=1 Tax=Paenibacillus sp. YPG26 TaxID=2878915 RepID=UPI00203BCD21|nr:N-acetylmuramoyl-L-alanine amidase [Paenibacillus sp. YPG26]USB32201.1 N-acetylmuramoyl-L-alanine amidase [Paenibacillus sp. YPG26]
MRRLISILIGLQLITVWISPQRIHANPQDMERLSRHAFPEPVILIDAGHGGVDGGTSFREILEKDINLDISRKLYLLLKSKGYAAALNRSADYALSDDNQWLNSRSRHRRDLAQRKGLSDELSTSIVVSIHLNWAHSRTQRGPLVLHQNEGRSAVLAWSIQNELNTVFGTRSSPALGRPFYLLNHIQSPAVIVETGFLSNAEDRAMLTRPTEQMEVAKAIVAGIMAYFTEL